MPVPDSEKTTQGPASSLHPATHPVLCPVKRPANPQVYFTLQGDIGRALRGFMWLYVDANQYSTICIDLPWSSRPARGTHIVSPDARKPSAFVSDPRAVRSLLIFNAGAKKTIRVSYSRFNALALWGRSCCYSDSGLGCIPAQTRGYWRWIFPEPS